MNYVKKYYYKKDNLQEPCESVYTLDLSRKEYCKITKHISNYNNLASLDVSHNRLVSLPSSISHCNKLAFINCSYNMIETLDLNNLSLLNTLDCSHNRLYEIHLDKCTSLDALNVQYNYLFDIVLPAKSFRSVFLEYNCLKRIPNIPADCVSASLSCNHIHHIADEFSSMPNLKNLYIYKNKLNSLALSNIAPSTLELLNASYNYIEHADFSGAQSYAALRTINLCNNRIETFQLCHPHITEIDISYNQISALDLTACPNLEKCICKMNTLQSLLLPDLKLTFLDASYNSLSIIPTQTQHLLQHLNLENNFIDKVGKSCFEKTPLLAYINLSKNKIDRISANVPAQIPSAKTLNLSNNPLYQLPPELIIQYRNTLSPQYTNTVNIKIMLFNCPIEKEISSALQATPNLYG
jgi:Leucine-rich repeat (LRR) protein